MTFTTNVKDTTIEIRRRYNQRGDGEKTESRNLDLIYGVHGFELQHLGTMGATFRFILVAFKAMSIFKQGITTNEIHYHETTIKI